MNYIFTHVSPGKVDERPWKIAEMATARDDVNPHTREVRNFGY